MYKTHTCGELRKSHIGETVTLAGWVHNFRNHGGVTFIDLRDRFGIVQVVGNPEVNKELVPLKEARSEWVLQVTGEVRPRLEGAENPDLCTGEIEIAVKSVKVLNKSKMLPILINKDEEVDESLRLKFRYLDLRRSTMRRNLELRHKTIKFIRDYLDN
ncbi:MAG: aspartate--tRNA ligase, partial [Anaerolineaceae bacterium 4572_5.1]